MKTTYTPKSRIIVPFFLLTGLLTILTGCGTSQPRPAETEAVIESAPETAAAEQEKQVRIKELHPRQYTVKKGDTLWDISSLFLKDPWYWPEIWLQNEQVKNPHLIYPGDVLTLIYVNGVPQIQVSGSQQKAGRSDASGELPVKKLSPGIRSTALDVSIPSIPGDAIRQFLTQPRVVTKEQMENAPRIIGSDDEHLILGTGHRIYIRGEIDKERVRMSVFNPGDKLLDPQTGELLGYEAKYCGDVHIKTYGDPATGDLTFTKREVLIGDRLLAEDKSKQENMFFPHVPDRKIDGQIISLYDALFGVAQFQIVVINRGERDGMEIGNILSTFTQGAWVRDHHDKDSNKPVKLPNERSGLIMVFKTFDRVSYALTLESKRVIHTLDYVKNPVF
jgi:hypothetical protein